MSKNLPNTDRSGESPNLLSISSDAKSFEEMVRLKESLEKEILDTKIEIDDLEISLENKEKELEILSLQIDEKKCDSCGKKEKSNKYLYCDDCFESFEDQMNEPYFTDVDCNCDSCATVFGGSHE